ncbi:MAG: threonylcarbamoyl-AMP synthase [Clostridia bacterium]|nr:threonylcarbamoyl-AMP synthase [Clostridia bacterium]
MKIYNENEIDKLAEILKNDGVISVPTDTVYGICSRISSKKAHDRLIKIKERPVSKAFPIMCADERQIEDIAVIDSKARKIINSFMPGPITIILKKKDDLEEYITNGKDTIAIRMATSNTLKELILKTGSPIFLTSANKSGDSTCTTIDEIKKACPDIDGILDGKVLFGKASTIVDCTSDEIKILREGPISLEEIQDSL